MYIKVGVIAALIILPIAGFFAGVQYQKQTSGSAAQNTNGQIGSGPRMFRGGAFGTVKAISSTGITVTERRGNTDKTYTITSDTTYKNGTAAAQASDVKVGNTVMLELDTSDTSKVKTITVNPTMMRSDSGPTTETMVQ